MPDFLTITFSFVLTGLVGNAVVQRWQYRNWIAQQKVTLAQQRNSELLKLYEEIERLASARRFRCFRSVSALRKGETESIVSSINDYDKSVVEWNERYTSFMARLRIYRSFETALRLETNIHLPLVACGEQISQARIAFHNGDKIEHYLTSIEKDLQYINSAILAFSRDYLGAVDRERFTIIDSDESEFTRDTLDSFSTAFLFRALFTKRDRYYL